MTLHKGRQEDCSLRLHRDAYFVQNNQKRCSILSINVSKSVKILNKHSYCRPKKKVAESESNFNF